MIPAHLQDFDRGCLMVVRTRYYDEEPCWADVIAPDVAAAKRLYDAVFGWTFADTQRESGSYVLCLKEDQPVAALAPRMSDAGTPPVWNTYLRACDVATTLARIEPAGGRLLTAAAETVDGSRMLLASDPGGAVFGLWEPRGTIGARVYGEPGAITWAEANTRHPAAVDAFYRRLFGVEPVAWRDIPEEFPGDAPAAQTGMDYVVHKAADSGPMLRGRLAMTANFGDAPPHWMMYFNVDDADRAADRVTDSGGRVVVAPFDTPYGRVTLAADPNGAVLVSARRQSPGPEWRAGCSHRRADAARPQSSSRMVALAWPPPSHMVWRP